VARVSRLSAVLAVATTTVVTTLVAVAGPAGAASAPAIPVVPHVTPRLDAGLALHSSRALPAVAGSAAALATFTDSFSYAGNTYPYTMVGTDPATSTASTTVPTSIQPIKLVFFNGREAISSTVVNNTAKSPLFTNASFSSGTTQYGDAIQRAEFWKYTQGTGYHALLGTPALKSTITIKVPSADGALYQTTGGTIFGAVEINWFDAQIQQLAASYPASSFPIFLTNQTVLYQGNINNCCIGGYHNAISGGHTYAWASWFTKNLFGPGENNVAALSHEVAEWFNDPYTTNTVPNWQVPSEPQYGCNNSLEVGDPLVGTTFTVGSSSLQDEAFFSWFAHQQPSIGIGGNYTYLGTFTSPAPTC
jgi:hypothetical protein